MAKIMQRNDLSHNELIQFLNSLGYSYSLKGICSGFAMMGIQAFLSDGHFKNFDNRLQFIKDNLNLADQIRPILKKIHDGEDLDQNDKILYKNYLDVIAFFDNLLLYQSPLKFKKVFNEFILQRENIKVSQIAQSDLVKEKSGLVEVDSSGGIYTVKELTDYLGQLRHLLNGKQQNITLLIGPSDHAISVCYDAKKQEWTVIDANNFKDTGIFRATFTDTSHEHPSSVDNFMAKLICEHALTFSMTDIFRYEGGKIPFLLDIRAITTQDETKKLEKIFNQFKKTKAYKNVDEITLKQAQHPYEHDGVKETLLEWAITNNRPDMVKKIGQLGVDLNQEMKPGISPLLYAVEYNSTEVIDELISSNVDINQLFSNRNGAAHIAASRGRIDILRVIDHHQGDLNLKDIYKNKPAYYAKQHGYTHVVHFIDSVNVRNALLQRLDKLSSNTKQDDDSNRKLISQLKQRIVDVWQVDDKKDDHFGFIKRSSMFEQEMAALSYQVKSVKKDKVKYTFFENAPKNDTKFDDTQKDVVTRKITSLKG